MLILAIETSCDETAAALVEDGRVLSSAIFTQIDIHRLYGGVVPEIASRNHILKISEIVDRALREADKTLKDLDKIAVTKGPGLVGALLVGLNYAKGLAYALDVPLIGVNHLKAHMLSPLITNRGLKPPFMALLVSGGHTYIAHCRDYNDIEILGSTRDDAAGEAFDKVARTLGLPYPGGPMIDEAAKTGDSTKIYFPRAYLEEDSLDFSFSGLKSSVLMYMQKQRQAGQELSTNDVAASFQASVIEVLVTKALSACQKYGVDTLLVSGGVAANSALRSKLEEEAEGRVAIYYPELRYCGDNAAMIGFAAFYEEEEGDFLSLNAEPGLELV